MFAERALRQRRHRKKISIDSPQNPGVKTGNRRPRADCTQKSGYEDKSIYDGLSRDCHDGFLFLREGKKAREKRAAGFIPAVRTDGTETAPAIPAAQLSLCVSGLKPSSSDRCRGRGGARVASAGAGQIARSVAGVCGGKMGGLLAVGDSWRQRHGAEAAVWPRRFPAARPDAGGGGGRARRLRDQPGRQGTQCWTAAGGGA